MSTWGSCEFGDLIALRDRLKDKDAERRFLESCVKELAARLLRKVVFRTPVGQYPSETGKNGGTLRRGWTGQKDMDIAAYVQTITVKHVGNMYEIEIINPVEYASYVEYGHRQTPGRFVPAIGKKLKVSWAPGRFMLTISEDELRSQAPAILEKKLQRYLEGCINGK